MLLEFQRLSNSRWRSCVRQDKSPRWVGVPNRSDFSLDPLVQKAVTLQGSFSHNWPVWEMVLSLLAAGKIDLRPVLNRVSPLDRVAGGF